MLSRLWRRSNRQSARTWPKNVRSLDLERLSESQLVQQLRAVVTATLPSELVAPLAEALVRRQQDGMWLDLTTTATAANSLLDARELLDSAGPTGIC